MATFRDPAAAQAGGYLLVPAGILVAAALALHPLPARGFEESVGVLAASPLWGPIHVAIAAGFVLTALGGLLVLVSGGPGNGPATRLAWAAMTIGILFFSGVALLNGWVMDPLARHVAAGGDRLLFDTMNRLLVGFGWLGNPLFLAGLTLAAWLEVRAPTVGGPRALAVAGLAVALLSWLRGVGSATGIYELEVFIYANVPAFLWLAAHGWLIARSAGMARSAGQAIRA